MKTSDIAPVSLSRRELYDLVWSVPVPEAAARLGISRTWLTKICNRAKVPYPTRAHWALVASGKRPARAKLGNVKVEDVIILRPRGRARPHPLAASESEDEIDLPDRLTRLHPVLTAWRVEIWHELERLRREPWRKQGGAPVELGKRRLRLLDALLKALERRGHAIESCAAASGQLELILDHWHLEFVLREDSAPAREPVDDLPAEAADILATKPWLASPPVASLSLEVRMAPEPARVARWEDQPDARLEDQLAEILNAISRMARASGQPGEWPAGANPAATDPEGLGWLALNRAAAGWEASDRVRRYVAYLAERRSRDGADLTPAQAAWLDWAEAAAARREGDQGDIDKAIAATTTAVGRAPPWPEQDQEDAPRSRSRSSFRRR